MDIHDFESQREPFENLCSECGMGRIAIYHTGPRYQVAAYPGLYRIIDRAQNQEESVIATATNQKNATLVADALNVQAGAARSTLAQKVLKEIEDVKTVWVTSNRTDSMVAADIILAALLQLFDREGIDAGEK